MTTSLFDSPVSGYRYVELLWGDTLQLVAARELDDASRWVDIANLNGLVYPFISEESGPGVAGYGDTILVPAPTAMASSTTDPDLVFEADVALVGGRIDAVDGDISLVSGLANFKQAIKHRLEVEQGDLVFHLDYGNKARRLIGSVEGPTAGLLAARYCKAAVMADPRVSRIESADAEIVGDKIAVEIEAQPISGRPILISTGV